MKSKSRKFSKNLVKGKVSSIYYDNSLLHIQINLKIQTKRMKKAIQRGFPKAELQSRFNKAQSLMNRHDFDALLLTSE